MPHERATLTQPDVVDTEQARVLADADWNVSVVPERKYRDFRGEVNSFDETW